MDLITGAGLLLKRIQRALAHNYNSRFSTRERERESGGDQRWEGEREGFGDREEASRFGHGSVATLFATPKQFARPMSS